MIYFLLSGLIVALVLGWCLAKMAHDGNDDCMTNEYYNLQADKPVETDEIP